MTFIPSRVRAEAPERPTNDRGTGTVARAVGQLDRLLRIHFIGFTCVWPLLGLASAGVPVSAVALRTVLLVGLCFHFFGFLLNDVIDLPIDRTQPRRATDPLVSGSIAASTVLGVAIVQVPLAFLAAGWGGADLGAYVALASAFAGMAVYDVFGKRSANPVLTDLTLGLSGGALVMFGAAAGGGGVTFASWLVATYTTGYFLLFNGMHGGMRDIENDAARGARTTCLYLGTRLVEGRIVVSRRAAVFCWSLQTVLIVTVGLLVLAADYDKPTALGVAGLSAAAAAANAGLMHIVLNPGHARWEEAYRLHLLTLILALIVVLAPRMGPRFTVFVSAFFVLPLTLIEQVPQIVRWLLPGLEPKRAESTG